MTGRRSSLLVAALLPALSLGSGSAPAVSEAADFMTQSVSDATRRQLLDHASRFGQVPVLVELRLPPADVEASPTIAAVRTRLFADLTIASSADGVLAGPGISNVKVFDTQPLIALTVTPEALARLLAHPLVGRVSPDGLARPG